MKKNTYEIFEKQLTSLIEDDQYLISILANMAALLNETLDHINWVGFYLYNSKNNHLYLGPFQGKPACQIIQMDRGVCGAAATKRKSILVEDVHYFPGHIACDSASNSEIVIPILVGGELLGVLDIDSPRLSRFDKEDQRHLEKAVEILENHLEKKEGVIYGI